MQQVKDGDKVKIHYHGRLEDGSVFDSSLNRQPFEFEVGSGSVIPGFDEGVRGMQVGDKKTIQIPAAEAYGEYDDTRVIEFPLSKFPPDIQPEVGMGLQLSDEYGRPVEVIVSSIENGNVYLDANHHLAGKDLIFDLELLDIEGKSPLIIMP